MRTPQFSSIDVLLAPLASTLGQTGDCAAMGSRGVLTGASRCGKSKRRLRMLCSVCSVDMPRKGERPNTSSYRSTPSCHQSTSMVCAAPST
eukprot:scaffold2926_cov399-Prasinococcus_capsulatus_cf.AAC.17